ncbi:CCA tRNA nucleotidyltransferase [Aggregicoccus sp. 17bor-14]|uniref:CCA tRNA nucleotidyltransferase n=1 Tax=Myxococcaceae TaxID=31 RepID=UPI00129CF615|nr:MULTISPECIES: CCA tRNA nucleotidyltransferase [Myxococcaceae]MBF5043990.1 CCA tRNA nucleotidyltransferase [Simulacricoccus sp. 17bor-14]MRI89741.1 CCA tRNA nucleotidyltransferase [Aggregicoccus sp. 17bor-14]
MTPAVLKNAAIPRPVLDVLSRLREQGHAAYLVGGCVRDMLRGREPKDFDVASSARPEEVQRAFRKVIPTGIEHGTVTVLSGGVPVEVTTFRSEGEYVDGRRPESVTFEREVTADLSRRDFTINAMAYDPVGGELCDPFAGQQDLARSLIRAVGDAHARFSEDGLRPLRAVRFAAVLGFGLDPATEAAIAPTVPVFRKVALERVREEFVKLLLSPRAEQGLLLLARTGLLAVFLPELAALPDTEAARVRASVQAAPVDLDVRLAVLLADLVPAPAARDVALRLKFPNKVAERVGLLVAHHALQRLFEAPDAELRRLLAKAGPENAEALLAIARARLQVRAPAQLPALEALGARLRAQVEARPPLNARALALNGAAVMAALGVGPSPAVGEATRFLVERVLEDPSLNSPEGLQGLLAGWKASRPA